MKITEINQIYEGKEVYLPNLAKRGVVTRINYYQFDPAQVMSVNVRLEDQMAGEYYEAHLMEIEVTK